jgi:hypothetical protein
MNRASQQLMSDAGQESRNLIRQAVDYLNMRLHTLESHARSQEAGLQKQLTVKHGLQQNAGRLLELIRGMCV